MIISIHALLKRATFLTHKITPSVEDFNSRSPEESDLIENVLSDKESISIHALLKRATHIMPHLNIYASHFNSRSPEESDATFSRSLPEFL